MRFHLALLISLAVPVAFPQDARDIVRRSVARDQRNWELTRNYTYVESTKDREFDGSGKLKKEESEVYEVSYFYGQRYHHLVQKNGKPLNAKDDRKEKEQLAKFTAKYAHETEEHRKKRLADVEKNRQKQREFAKEIPDAYDFRILGEEKVDGRDTWVIAAEPHPGYRPKIENTKYLSKIRGKLWIEKKDLDWVKLQAESIDTISFGLVLFRLYKGARIEFEQTRVNDEIWLPKRTHITGAARIALFKKGGGEYDSFYSQYRKFQSDSRLVGAEELK
jgi:hypothetical protein